MIGAGLRARAFAVVCTFALIAAAVVAVRAAPSPLPTRGGFPVSALTTKSLDIGSGTASNGVSVVGGAAQIVPYKDTFEALVNNDLHNTAGCPEAWGLYNPSATAAGTWSAPDPLRPGRAMQFNWSTTSTISSYGIEDACSGSSGLAWWQPFRMDFELNVHDWTPCGAFGCVNVADLFIGFGNANGGATWNACGPVLDIQSKFNDNKLYYAAAVIGTPGTNNKLRSAQVTNVVPLNSWVAASVAWNPATRTVTATVGGTSFTVTTAPTGNPWTGCAGGLPPKDTGAFSAWACAEPQYGGSCAGYIAWAGVGSVYLDNVDVAWPRQGCWTSAPVTSAPTLQQATITYQVQGEGVASQTNSGTLQGVYVNDSSGNRWKDTTTYSAFSTNASLSLAETVEKGTGGWTGLGNGWQVTICLTSKHGLDPVVAVTDVTVQFIPPPTGGPPPPNPCPYVWSCIVNETLVQQVSSAVCNLWVLIFLAVALATAAVVVRVARRGSPPSQGGAT